MSSHTKGCWFLFNILKKNGKKRGVRAVSGGISFLRPPLAGWLTASLSHPFRCSCHCCSSLSPSDFHSLTRSWLEVALSADNPQRISCEYILLKIFRNINHLWAHNLPQNEMTIKYIPMSSCVWWILSGLTQIWKLQTPPLNKRCNLSYLLWYKLIMFLWWKYTWARVNALSRREQWNPSVMQQASRVLYTANTHTHFS